MSFCEQFKWCFFCKMEHTPSLNVAKLYWRLWFWQIVIIKHFFIWLKIQPFLANCGYRYILLIKTRPPFRPNLTSRSHYFHNSESTLTKNAWTRVSQFSWSMPKIYHAWWLMQLTFIAASRKNGCASTPKTVGIVNTKVTLSSKKPSVSVINLSWWFKLSLKYLIEME